MTVFLSGVGELLRRIAVGRAQPDARHDLVAAKIDISHDVGDLLPVRAYLRIGYPLKAEQVVHLHRSFLVLSSDKRWNQQDRDEQQAYALHGNVLSLQESDSSTQFL